MKSNSQNEGVRYLTWVDKVRAAGPWNQQRTPDELLGAPSLPMPVKIAEPDSLAPCFDHISLNGSHLPMPLETFNFDNFTTDYEPNYKTPYIEFEKGVIYEDQRVDLCKQVLGPTNIDALLDSLEHNTFIKHFLLGNNIIDPAGCRRIARFLQQYPDRMDTWYLAGNCIDTDGFRRLVVPLANSVATNVWLKRNPLGLLSAIPLEMLITGSSRLQTLDLDQTGLGDEGVSCLFDLLARYEPSVQGRALSLKNLYLNADGIGPRAAASVNRFLLSPYCQLEALYLSNNPLGDEGIIALSANLAHNVTLQRLMLSSTGITSKGAAALLTNLTGHLTLTTLDLSQNYATQDLNAHFNFIDDCCSEAIIKFIRETDNLRLLDLDYNALSCNSIHDILLEGVLQSASLCEINLRTIKEPKQARRDSTEEEKREQWARKQYSTLKPRLNRRFEVIIEEYYGRELSIEEFHNQEVRWLRGPKEDLRKIDSVYRNRNAGLARRGLKKLDKWWSEEDSTLDKVMAS